MFSRFHRGGVDLVSGVAAANFVSPCGTVHGKFRDGVQDDSTGSVAAPAGQLGEIIVTAQRRTESLQHAAVPVYVLSAQALLKAEVSDPIALGTPISALTATPADGSRVNFFLRDVGNATSNPLFESAIACNYDGVYIGRPGSTLGLFYDLERVEVRRGPQGTLYGRNATGGAINVLPTKPKPGQLSGYVTGRMVISSGDG